MLLPRGKIRISSAKYWFWGMRILKSSNTTWQLWICQEILADIFGTSAKNHLLYWGTVIFLLLKDSFLLIQINVIWRFAVWFFCSSFSLPWGSLHGLTNHVHLFTNRVNTSEVELEGDYMCVCVCVCVCWVCACSVCFVYLGILVAHQKINFTIEHVSFTKDRTNVG